MYIYIFGFSLENSEDDSLKLQLEIDSSFNEQVLRLLGQKNLDAMIENEQPLTTEQVTELSSIIGQPLPTDLRLVIGIAEDIEEPTRARWKDSEDRIFEWDYEYGFVDIYDKEGTHLGGFDADNGDQIKPAICDRTVEV